MGREVKRVALDFNHPLREVWPGFLLEEDEAYDPPAGDGWQLWETVSDGSPVSPVFATAEDLAEWMTVNDCTAAGPVSSRDVALRFVEAGWAPSAASMPGVGPVSGVEWVGRVQQ